MSDEFFAPNVLPAEMWFHILRYLDLDQRSRAIALQTADAALQLRNVEQIVEALDYVNEKLESEVNLLQQIRQAVDRQTDEINRNIHPMYGQENVVHSLEFVSTSLGGLSAGHRETRYQIDRLRKRVVGHDLDDDSSSEIVDPDPQNLPEGFVVL